VEFVGPGLPAGRVGAATAVIGTRLYVFGGYGLQADGTLGNFGDAYVVDLNGPSHSWKHIDGMPIASRWSSARAIDDRYVMIAGGYADNPVKGFLDGVWLYDALDDISLTCDPLPLPVATMASGVGAGGAFYLAGGEDAMRHRSASFFIGRIRDR